MTVKPLRSAASVTPAALGAARDVYARWFRRDPYIHWEDFWPLLYAEGYAMLELDCPAAHVIINHIKQNREEELRGRRQGR
jgi:hypothetical protein